MKQTSNAYSNSSENVYQISFFSTDKLHLCNFMRHFQISVFESGFIPLDAFIT